MATPGERFKQYVDSLAVAWSARLGKWTGTAIGAGIDAFMKILGKSFAPKLKPLIEEMKQNKELPPWMAPILEEILNPTGEAAGMFGNLMTSSAMGGLIDKLLAPSMLPIVRFANKLSPQVKIGADLVWAMALRHPEDMKIWSNRLAQEGFNDTEQGIMWELLHTLFPSQIVAPAWLRDKAKWGKYWDDVKKLGVTDDRIELLKEMAYSMPSVRDVVGFLAHEVFEPAMIAKYGLDDEWAGVDKSLFDKVGLKEEMALNYWRDHWQHASWGQITEMLHRGEVTEQDVYDWFRLVEIPPYWRKGLTALMWNLPGRVELRMMAQYGLVNKQFCVDLLKKDGLAEEYRDVVADMMIVRGIRSDLQTRYTKKWLDSAGVRAEIDKAGLSKDIGDRLYQWIVTNTKPDRTAAEKDLTVAQVTKAVRRGDIAWNDGILRLREQGYDEVEADLVMMQSVEVVEAEPTTELNVRVDTIRRQRRQRLITRDQEIVSLLDLGLDSGLATAYADNDDLRLVKETTGGS
jgi:hypothetical protein